MEVANIYDNGPISPIAKIKNNLSIWTLKNWAHYRIENIEPLAPSNTMVAEMVTLSGALVLPANGTITKIVVPILQPAENEFLHLRWEPIDDVQGILWEQASVERLRARAVTSRVTRMTRFWDPFLATTTFCIIGMQRDMNLEVRNPNPVALPQARFIFYGFRYDLIPLDKTIADAIENGKINTTWVPAEGF